MPIPIDTTDSGLTQYLLAWAVGALGILVTILTTVIGFLCRSYALKQDTLEDELDDVKRELTEVDKRLALVQTSALTYSDVKQLFEDRFEPIKESSKRIEECLGKVTCAIEKVNMKMAVMEDRDTRSDIHHIP